MPRADALVRSALNLIQRGGVRWQSTVPKPVITAPVQNIRKLQRMLEESQKNDRVRYQQQSQSGNTKVCLISCKDSKLNHYLGQSYGKFDSVLLTSKGWDHRRSNGDYFTINSRGPNPSLLPDGATFEELGLNSTTVEGLTGMGHTKPTSIQKLATKQVLRGSNCLIAAETGSGKTLSYLAPLVQLAAEHRVEGKSHRQMNQPLVVIITPGRELCEQISSVCCQLAENTPVKVLQVTGGRLKQKMMQAEVADVDILVGTFGAISKLTNSGVYDMTQVRTLVLDEADTLLDDSFNEKLVHFLRKFTLQMTLAHQGSTGVQLVLASATMPRSAEQILADVLPFDSFVKVTTEHLHRLMPHVPQKFLRLSHLDKPAKLLELVKKDTQRQLPVIVFSNQAQRCDWVSLFLNENGVKCVNLNGAMSHHLRQDRYQHFADGRQLVLSCTDVVSRGLDTGHAHHVINYDVPTNMSDYVHRCGRVGRVGSHHASGVVTTLVCHPAEAELVQKIEFAARKLADGLPNVNANVKRLLTSRALKKEA